MEAVCRALFHCLFLVIHVHSTAANAIFYKLYDVRAFTQCCSNASSQLCGYEQTFALHCSFSVGHMGGSLNVK